MSDRSFDDEVRTFYEAENLAEERVAAILDSRDFAVAARRWKRIAVTASCVAATMLLLVVVLAVPERSHLAEPTSPESISLDSRNIAPSVSPAEPGPGESIPASGQVYRLVAFRSHSDECPDCRETEQVFANLTRNLNGSGVEFELFDLSSDAQRTHTIERIAELHISALIKGRTETAFFALIDQNGASIQEFKPSQSTTRIASRIRELVD